MAEQYSLPPTAVIPTLTNTSGLKVIVRQLLEAGVEVVVVDNGPTEEKREWAKSKKITYLPQESNLGFAEAVNLGAKQAKTEWLLVANDDVEINAKSKKQKAKSEEQTKKTRLSINRLIDTAERNGWVAVSPVLTNPISSSYPDYNNQPERHPDLVSGSSSLKVENIGYSVLPIGRVKLNFDPNKNTSKDLDGLTAAFLLIKRDVFETVGGFDESFFAYLEDVDLFLTLKEKGYEFGVETEVRVRHNHLSTSKEMRGFKESRDFVNWWRMSCKHNAVIKNLAFLFERLRNIAGLLKVYRRESL